MPASFHALTPALERMLCQLCRVDPEVWGQTKALYASGNAWRIHKIPKRNGFRTIHAPSDPLMAMSRGILKQIIQTMPTHMCVHGAHPRTSVVTNARVHAGFGKAFYILDIKNAFPSTKRKRVEKVLGPKIERLIEDATDLLPAEAILLRAVIIDLLLVDDAIPQGFPTSPGVLNVVLRPTDSELNRYLKNMAEELGCEFRMTRYVDDIAISTDADEIPKKVRRKIRKIINGNGWVLARTKVRYHGEAETGDPERSTKMPVVTGLIPHLDGRVTIPRPKLSTFRGVLHRLLELGEARKAGAEEAIASARAEFERDLAALRDDGVVFLQEPELQVFYPHSWPLTPSERDQVVGIVGFVSMVYDGELPSVIQKPYRRAKAEFKIGRKAARRRHFYNEEAA